MIIKKNDKIVEIPGLSKVDRPRELLFEHGAEYLSDMQLVAIVLGSGSKGSGVMQLSRKVLDVFERNPVERVDPVRLKEIKGLGQAKAAQLAAAFEFSRRRIMPSMKRINSPSDVVPLLFAYAGSRQENFICISLNGAHEVIAIRLVSVGTLNRTIVHPREVFADPLTDRASGIICAHNHPSGNTEPSREDVDLTERLIEAGTILGIGLLDHIILSARGYYSFLENGML